MICRIVTVAAAIMAVSGGASAATAQGQMVSAANPSSIVQSLQATGYKADLGKDGTGDPLVSSSSSGTSFAIYFYGCTKNVACKTVQFSASYADGAVPLTRINEWNRTKRWGQAYTTDSGSARVQMDVDLEQGGMTNALFTDNLEYWVATMAEFEKFVVAK
jgi:hypothetical protein